MEPQIEDEIISFDTLVRDAERLCERRSKDALPLIERAGTYASVSENLLHRSTVKHLKAYYHSVVLNEYDECVQILNDILQALDADELNVIGPKLFMTRGNAYQLKGDVFEAQGSYLRGIRLLEAKEDRSEKERELQASYYYNMTLSLASSQLKISSVEYLDKAIEIYKELNATRLLARCYVLYSGSYEEQGDLESAEQMLEQALIINKQNNDNYSIALAEANLGIINNRMGRHDRACEYLSQTLKYYESNELYFELAMVQTALGECHFKTGKYKDGLEIIEEAEKVLTAIDNKQELSKLYKTAATLLYEAEDYKRAYDYLHKHNESINSFFDIEKTNALARAKREFENEQQEKESTLLRQKNEEIKKYVHKLEGSNNSLKQFAHVASHDLKEPLRSINGYMYLLKKSMGNTLNEQQNEFFDFAIKGAQRMDQLINDMLYLAKVDANPRIERQKLSGIIDEVRLNLEVLLTEKGGMITAGPMPEMNADRTQLLQIFQNLIGNGIKYNESKSPIVRIKSVMYPSHFEITIADNGIGIPESYRDKVFEVFQRLHAAESYDGTGIGLSVCKKLVDGMHGHINIHDNPNGGTIFKLSFKNDLLASAH